MAAIRYPIERDGEGEIRYGNALRNVEVGWVNLYDRGVKRAKVAESGTLAPDDASGWRTGDEAAATAEILSVSMAGIFVCPHNNCEGSDKLATFVDLQGRARPVSIPQWPPFMMQSERLGVRADMIHVDGVDAPMAFVQQTIAIGRAQRSAEGFRFQAMGLLPQSARQSDYRVHYSWAFMEGPHQPALSVTVVHEREPAAYARASCSSGARTAASQPCFPLPCKPRPVTHPGLARLPIASPPTGSSLRPAAEPGIRFVSRARTSRCGCSPTTR
jgi:hypothetical protein